jgi:hypothetical protein
MSNLVSRTRTVHAPQYNGSDLPMCGSRVAMLNGTTGHHSVTCGTCVRIIAKAHAEALELHKAFLLGVAQAEASAKLLGRPEGLYALADTELSDEILWARSELALRTNTDWLTAYARRLTLLKLEREWRRENMAA